MSVDSYHWNMIVMTGHYDNIQQPKFYIMYIG